MEKKKITIEVEPATAVATVGLLRGIFPSIIEQLERQAATNGSPLKFNKVENMQYRGNGWPSGMQIRLSNGETIYKDNYTNPWKLMHQSKLFRPKRCLMCKEDISYKADISLADPWLEKYKENDRIGNTMFLVNTEIGLSFIEEMKKQFALQVIDSSEDYMNAQGHTVKAKMYAFQERKLNDILSKMGSNVIYKTIVTFSPSMLKLHMFIIRVIHKLIN